MESTYRLSILHPTDPSDAGQVAFAHALKVALIFGAKLHILCSKTVDTNNYERPQMPPVRKTLENWNLLEEGSGRSEVFRELGISVKKIDHQNLSPMTAIAYHLESHDVDLIVYSAHLHNGLKQGYVHRFMQQVMHDTGAQILYIPEKISGFVSNRNGNVSLREIIVPVVQAPHPESALNDASALARTMGRQNVKISLVHIGEPAGLPSIQLPDDRLCTWNTIVRQGDIADEINALAYILPADLIVVTTRNHHDANKSTPDSVTARILPKAPCPVLIIPSSS
jgi:nucleotide-binding universal stress UspA family protein